MARSKKIPQIVKEKTFLAMVSEYIKKSKRNLSKKEQFARVRNAIIFLICYYQGFRPKEAKDIKLEHIDFLNQMVYIPAENNKQRNQDIFPLQKNILEKIKEYIVYKNKFFDKSDWLFPSLRDSSKPVYRGTLIRAFTQMISIFNLKQISYIDKQGNKRLNLSIYSLRHSFGTNAMHKIKDVKQVARLMRHYDPQCRSTYIYIHTDQMLSRKDLLCQVYKKKTLKIPLPTF